MVREWTNSYAERGIELHFLDRAACSLVDCRHPNATISHATYRWLAHASRAASFDVIHFPDYRGHAYYSVMAKRLGHAFADSELVVGTHGPTRWLSAANGMALDRLDDLITDHFERRSVELADVVVSPSAFMVDWLRAQRWAMPARSFVQQNIQPRNVTVSRTVFSAPATEIVFFGRLETRKGLELFCDAMDLLVSDRGVGQLRLVTFLGRSSETRRGVDGVGYAQQRARHWPWSCQVLSDLGQEEAIQYLRDKECVAVVASLVDNSPNTVLELVGLGVPFVASVVGGTAELIATADLPDCGFDARRDRTRLDPATADEPPSAWCPAVVASAIRAVLPGGYTAARLAIDPRGNERAHLRWHADVARAQRQRRMTAPIMESTPHRLERPGVRGASRADISICLGGAATLSEVATTLGVQTVRALEVVVSQALPDSNETRIGSIGSDLRVVTRAGALPGQALRGMIESARGRWLLLLDSGVVLDPRAIEALAAGAMTCTDAVITFATKEKGTPRIRLPLGGPAQLGLFCQCLSGSGYVVEREVAETVAHFVADAKRWRDAHHGLLAALALRGTPMLVYPDTLASSVPFGSDRRAKTPPGCCAPKKIGPVHDGLVLPVPWPYAASASPAVRDVGSRSASIWPNAFGGGSRVRSSGNARHVRFARARARRLAAAVRAKILDVGQRHRR
jgi:glycosyltransferase involved in cell wall biosynthesis